MKKTLLLSACSVLIKILSFAQTPQVQWQKNLQPYSYSTAGENIYSMSRVKSGGFIFVGSDTVYYPSKSSLLNKEYGERPLIMRTDGSGNTLWSRTLPPYDYGSFFSSVIETDKQEIVAAGFGKYYINSAYKYDFVVAKYSSNGNLSWYKGLGGSKMEYAQSIIQSKDGNFVVAGYTNSNDLNVSGNHGTNTYDFWVVKLDNYGNLLWQKCFGGSGDDKAYSIKQTFDGGYIVVGKNSSVDGNVTNNKGGTDAWVIKLDSNGNLQWEKSIGGSLDDVFESVSQASDGSYIVTGYTYSNDKDINGNHGNADVLLVKLGSSGNIVWQKCLGGSAEDQSYSIEKTVDNAFLVSGHTVSNDGDVTNNNGGSDVWVIKINSIASLIWQKTVGSAKNEYSMSVSAISENLFAIAGFGDPESNINYLDGYLYEIGNSSSIKGSVFMDYNSNGIKETDEPYVSNVMVKTEKKGLVQSAIPFNGSFKNDVDTGTYQTTAVLNNLYYTISPGVHNTTFNSYFNTDSFSFAVQPIAGKRDLSTSLIPLDPARPGFYTSYKIFYKNKGTETWAAGTVQLVKSNKLRLIYSTPAVTSVSGDTLRWNYSNLKPEDSASIIISFAVAQPPAVNIGDKLSSTVTISPVATDLTPSDDTSRLSQTVIGSYDPNDKNENNGGIIKPSQIQNGDYLLYTIRFQNTGTDTAFNVVIRDTLSDKVDVNSLQMVNSSHGYQLNIKDGDKLTWSFNNIKLVDSVRNKSGSHGYIVYQIKPKNSVLPGDTIKNTAGIYFDFNLPVSTNTQRTMVESSVLPVKLVSFTAKRNAKQNEIEWLVAKEMSLADYTIERSSNGRDFKTIGNVKASNISSYSFKDVSPERTVNYYRLKMTDKDGRFEYSDVKKVNNTGSFDVTIYPNPVKNNLEVKFDSDKKLDVQWLLVDVNGKILNKSNLTVTAGLSYKNIEVSSLSKGTYFLITISEREQVAIKFDKL